MTGRLRLAIVFSGLGHLVHNVEEFGIGLSLVGQSVIPTVVTVLLWLRAAHPTRRYLGWTLAWTVLVVIGGGGSVFPFDFLPFVPVQTTSHYAAHLAYAVLQLPLLGVTWHALAHREGRVAPGVPRQRH